MWIGAIPQPFIAFLMLLAYLWSRNGGNAPGNGGNAGKDGGGETVVDKVNFELREKATRTNQLEDPEEASRSTGESPSTMSLPDNDEPAARVDSKQSEISEDDE